MLSSSQRKTVRNAFTFLRSFLERRWKESKYPTRFFFTWSPTVCRIAQSTLGSDRCAPLYIETNTADCIGISICNRRTTVYRSRKQATWKFPSVAQANFFSPPFFSRSYRSNQISNMLSNIFFQILRRSRFFPFFLRTESFSTWTDRRTIKIRERSRQLFAPEKFVTVTISRSFHYVKRTLVIDSLSKSQKSNRLINWTIQRDGDVSHPLSTFL